MNSAVMLLERAADIYGEKVALEDEESCLSFAQWRRLSRTMAAGLLKAGGRQEGAVSPVIVYLPKSIASLVSFQGALYSGNPYVPVDANMPLDRLQKIMDNLKPGHIVTNRELAQNLASCQTGEAVVHQYEDLIAGEADDALVEETLARVIDTDPVYIIYTSGSTGTPKGVVLGHRGVIDYAEWVCTTFKITSESILGNQSAFYFDNSVLDIYSCLYSGAKLVIIPEVLFWYPVKLPEFLKEKRINTIFWVPTVLINVANSGVLSETELPYLKKVLFCGEMMPNKQLNIWRRAYPGLLYANLYGPTEITDVCTYYIVDREFQDSDPLPIGKACRNMRIEIITEDNRRAKPGEQGELCVVGTGLALGYWNAREISDKVFVRNPLNPNYNEYLYRTGDLAYWNEEGLIILLGRMDSQIKLKGNRIELGEVENAAKCVPGVENACALFHAEAQEIVVFVQSGEELKLRKFNIEMKKYIPSYMLPGRLVVLPKLPLTPNGKIDRVTLKKEYFQ